mmetsp:Transcript_78643/g.220640  ORF Transcript_78643/g.220640 Transcript_78643/m.220640 type:complete len:225 (-) Transcript_78643:652-1326(-)
MTEFVMEAPASFEDCGRQRAIIHDVVELGLEIAESAPMSESTSNTACMDCWRYAEMAARSWPDNSLPAVEMWLCKLRRLLEAASKAARAPPSDDTSASSSSSGETLCSRRPAVDFARIPWANRSALANGSSTSSGSSSTSFFRCRASSSFSARPSSVSASRRAPTTSPTSPPNGPLPLLGMSAAAPAMEAACSSSAGGGRNFRQRAAAPASRDLQSAKPLTVLR